MKTMVEAMVHSLNSLAEVEIVEHKDNNHCSIQRQALHGDFQFLFRLLLCR